METPQTFRKYVVFVPESGDTPDLSKRYGLVVLYDPQHPVALREGDSVDMSEFGRLASTASNVGGSMAHERDAHIQANNLAVESAERRGYDRFSVERSVQMVPF